jgi:hypothetical protein
MPSSPAVMPRGTHSSSRLSQLAHTMDHIARESDAGANSPAKAQGKGRCWRTIIVGGEGCFAQPRCLVPARAAAYEWGLRSGLCGCLEHAAAKPLSAECAKPIASKFRLQGAVNDCAMQ